MATTALTPAPTGQRVTRRAWLLSMTLGTAISVVAILIGTHRLEIGPAAVVLFPILWAVLLGAAVGLQRWRRVTGPTRSAGELLIRVGIVLFLAKLGTEIGPALPELAQIGPAIALQELGNAFGTVVLGLPVAVAFGLGRVAIGATWSIDRESYLAYAIDRFGVRSPEYQGVFAVWLIGTVFGALYISLIAGLLGGLDIFDPRALALGLGLGSSSMMLGGVGALSILYPEMAGEIMALAAISNLVTNIVGFYLGVFVVLPFCRWLYRFWTRALGKQEADARSVEVAAAVATSGHEEQARRDPPVPGGVRSWALAFGYAAVAGLLMNWIGTGDMSGTALTGMVLVTAMTVLAFLIARIVPGVPASVWVLALATLLSAPFAPGSDQLVSLTEPLDVLLIGVPQIALLGLTLGRDVEALKRLNWRIFIVAFLTYTSAFVAAAAIAQMVLPPA